MPPVYKRCEIELGLRMRETERERLAAYAAQHDCPSLSAAIRHALPDIFKEPTKEGRPLGYSPRRSNAA
jgi:hypothetical protein